MSPAKKKGVEQKPPFKKRKPQEIVVITEQPVKITQATVVPGRGPVLKAFSSVGQGLFYLAVALIGLSPMLAHIGTAIYCGEGPTRRCTPVDYPPWMEFAGIIIAMIAANAAKDIVSKSAKQLFDAAKNLPNLLSRKSDPPTGGEGV